MRRSGFNGATAFRRWKHGWRRYCLGLSLASMGPPPFGGGNMHLRSVLFKNISASMGPPPFGGGNIPSPCAVCDDVLGFNGATAFRRWKQSLASSPTIGGFQLQWGHRLSAVETLSSKLPPVHHQGASMGPPPFGGGNVW